MVQEKLMEIVFWSLIGSLMYLTHTRLDIMYPISLTSKMMNEPSEFHF